MNTNTKERIKLGLVIISSLVVVVIMLSLFTGRMSTKEIIVVGDEGINTNAPLGEQLEYFKKIEISKKEFNLFNDSIVTDLKQLEDKKVNYNLAVGSPIPKDALFGEGESGQFAANLPEGKTVHLFPQAAFSLPPVSKGDLINVGVTFEDDGEVDKDVKSSILLYDLEVANIIEGNLYVIVDLEESLIINSAESIGDFFFQLPGKLALPYCSDLEEESEFEDEEKDETDIETSGDNINDVEKKELTVECLDDNFQPKEISSSFILSKLVKGESLNLSKRDLEKRIQELEKEIQNINDEDEKTDEDEELDEDETSGISGSLNSSESESEDCTIKGLDNGTYLSENDSGYNDYEDEDISDWFCSTSEAEEEGFVKVE